VPFVAFTKEKADTESFVNSVIMPPTKDLNTFLQSEKMANLRD
jgi:hypothetical protein